MRNVYILGRAGAHANEKIPVQDELIIGRDNKMCQLVYPASEKNISGVHCKIQEVNGKICLIDLDSTNGTFFQDGTRLTPNMPRTMTNGQGFYLGSRENSFDLLVEEPKRGVDVLGVVLCIFALVMIVAGLLFSWIFIGIGIILGLVGVQRIRNAGSQPVGASGAGSGNKGLTIALIVVLVLVIVVLGYAYYQATHKSDLEKLLDAGGVIFDWLY